MSDKKSLKIKKEALQTEQIENQKSPSKKTDLSDISPDVLRQAKEEVAKEIENIFKKQLN
jgi:hypothetical protein